MSYMNKQAFSLIELMVVVALISILAVVSVPYYFQYLAKAKQSEVALNLASLHTAMQAYYAEHNCYTTVLMGEGGVGWQPAGYHGGGKDEAFLYTYGFNFPGAVEGVHYFTGRLQAPCQALAQGYAEDGTFTASAAADIAGKGSMDVWTINETRTVKNVRSGLN